MAGIPWVVVFAALTLLAMNRGWSDWLILLFAICLGMGAANTQVGGAIFSGITGLISMVWRTFIGFVNGAL